MISKLSREVRLFNSFAKLFSSSHQRTVTDFRAVRLPKHVGSETILGQELTVRHVREELFCNSSSSRITSSGITSTTRVERDLIAAVDCNNKALQLCNFRCQRDGNLGISVKLKHLEMVSFPGKEMLPLYMGTLGQSRKVFYGQFSQGGKLFSSATFIVNHTVDFLYRIHSMHSENLQEQKLS